MKIQLMFIYSIISIRPPHNTGNIFKYYVFKDEQKVPAIRSSIKDKIARTHHPENPAKSDTDTGMQKSLHKILLESDIKPVQDAIGTELYALQNSKHVAIRPVSYGTAKYADIFINKYLYNIGYIMYDINRPGSDGLGQM